MFGIFDVHPVLGQQMGNRGMAAAPAPATDEDFDVGFDDVRVSRTVAAFVAGAVVTLVLLNWAGFRFSFGANIGGGS